MALAVTPHMSRLALVMLQTRADSQKLGPAEIVPVLGFKVEVMITVGGSWWPETTFTQLCLILIARAVQSNV